MAFDVQSYLDANPDVASVAANGNWTDAQVIEHYTTFGFAEGRPLFWDSAVYLDLNHDVQLFLENTTDWDANARAHYFQFGIGEHRAYFFDAEDYLAANADLGAAGITAAGALSHYLNFGRLETGRLLAFDYEGYLEMYSDLPQDWSFDQALAHYRAFGMAEGRAYDMVVEPEPDADNIIVAQDDAGAVDADNTFQLSVDGDPAVAPFAVPVLRGDNVTADGGDGTDTLRIVGNADIRIDVTNPMNQVEGLDLDGDGIIETNGIENNLKGQGILTVQDFEVFDAYRRDALDNTQTSADDNFLGRLFYDGTGFQGDGVNTDGNIVLGGWGSDEIYGGIGNDFLAGGGAADGAGGDDLIGGRNADFFFVEISDLDLVDGDGLDIDGGITWDNSAAQDTDWVLVEASDDNEPVYIDLAATTITTDTVFDTNDVVDIDNIENVDASGNLYGFLNNFDVVLGGAADYKASHAADGTENWGLGSTAQLVITGTAGSNILVGGYDNDTIDGDAGDDILLGGNMQFFEDNDNNPNILDIPNDGRDTLIGGDGEDQILFEMDRGVYEGGANENADDAFNDTLWITDYTPGASTSTLADMTTDSVIRIDLGVGKAGGLNNYSGYGGADENYVDNDYTSDQTLYAAGYARTQVQDLESVIATGLGAIDYDTDGTNNSELNFTEQMNFYGIDADLDLRGTVGDNTLYANTGDDYLEGREGDDNLSGGDNLDTFIFFLNQGDGLDEIHRQIDADDDNIWDVDADGEFVLGQDFGVDSASTAGASSLVVDFGTTDLSSADVAVTSFTITIGDVVFSASATEVAAANTAAELAAIVNAAFNAQDASVTATSAGNTVVVNDAEGRDISDTVAEGYLVGLVIANGNASAEAEFFPSGVTTSEDTLVFASYEDRADGELVDDDGFVNETGDAVTLGGDGYAEDLVVRFDSDGNGTTVLAEDQDWELTFLNLADEDTVSISVNGTAFSLMMGRAADGTAINENMTQFLARMVDLINAGSDNDTLAGTLVATPVGTDTISLRQGDYNAGQVAFMDRPIVTLGNASGGEPASVTIAQPNTDTEITLLDFNGRDANLNEGNVLFLGGSGMNDGRITNADNSRAILATADDQDGGALVGSDAMVVDSMTDPDTVATDFSLHGDDLLFTGDALDIVTAGTGDDRIFGSIGNDIINGGKDLYVVQTLVAGKVVEAVETLNEYDAAQRLVNDPDVVNVHLLEQDRAAGARAGFQDTLVFSTNDFADTTRFTITADDDLMQEFGGAGTVGVDVDGDLDIDHLTTFTEMEAIRTLAGDGTHAGQGHDTLDVADLSDAVAASVNGDDPDAAVVYNMTSELGFIQINADLNDDGEINDDPDQNPANADTADENDTFLAVDGVERFIGGNANEQLNIDESEVNKDNYFDGADEIMLEDDDDADTTDDPDLVGDSIVYDHTDMDNDLAADDDGDIDSDNNGVVDFNDTVAVSMRPSLEIIVESDDETDLVRMTGGTVVGSDTTEDTLVDVETINIANAAISATLDDTLDVSNVHDAVIDFTDGEVRDVDEDIYAQIVGMTEMEVTLGGAGDDLLQVANNMTNYRAFDITDVGTAIAYGSFLNYDIVDLPAGDRLQLSDLDADDRPEANNQALFTFDLAGGDDRVEYDLETGNIAAVIDLEEGETTQTVFVMGADLELTAFDDRIDLLLNVEEVVASQAQSILDFTQAGEEIQISFQYDENNAVEDLDRMESRIRIADGNGDTIDGISTFIEYYDMDDDDDVPAFVNATWNNIQGSDFAEAVFYDGSEDLVNEGGLDHRYSNDTLDLRGGENNVSYFALETSITAIINVTESDDDTDVVANDGDLDYSTGSIVTNITFQDGDGGLLAGGGSHLIRTYTSDNDVAAGTLKLEASQDAEDILAFTSASEKLYILGSSPGVIDVEIGDLDTMRLTGFEFLLDSASDDVYQFDSLVTGITYLDNAAADTDTISVTNVAVGYNNLAAPQDDDIDLGELSAGINIDFDILDVTRVTDGSVDLVGGSPGAQDETVILDDLSLFESITLFETIKLGVGTALTGTLTVDMVANELRNGANVIDIDANVGTLDLADLTSASAVDVDAPAGVDFEVIGGSGADSIDGGSGSDILSGNAGDDVINGGDEVGQISTYTFAPGELTDEDADFMTIAGLSVGPDANDSQNYAMPIGSAPADEDQVGQAFANISDDDWEAALEALFGVPSVAIDSVDYNANTNQLSVHFNPAEEVFGAIGNAALTDANANSDLAAPAEAITPFAGNGNDIIFGGAGVDTMTGGTGNDTFVVVGVVGADDYNVNAAVGSAAANFDVAVAAIENGQAVSDVTTDVFNGGVGIDEIEVWGDVDMTEATWNSINVLDIHSNVILTAEQLAQLDITLNGDDSQIFIGDDQHLVLTGEATLDEMNAFAALYQTGRITNANGESTVAQLAVTAQAESVNEGASVAFLIENGDANTAYDYTLSGITAADVAGGALTGTVTTDAFGAASVTVALLADFTTEGEETMTMTVEDKSDSVIINDTSVAGVGNTILIPTDSSDTFTGTAAVDTFVFDAVAALAAAGTVSQPVVDSFDVAADLLQLDLAIASGVTTLAALNGQQGVAVQVDPFAGDTLINFGNDADGDVVAITLSGITDAATVDVLIV